MGKCYVRFRECMDIVGYTPPKTNISPEKCWLEGFSIWNGSFSGDMLIVRGQSWLSHQYFQFRFGSNSHLSWHIDMILTKNYPKGNRPFNTNIILIRPPLAPLEFRTYMWNLPIDPLATAFIRLGRSEWLIYFARSRKCNRNMSRQRGRRSKKPWKSVVGSNEVSFSDGLCSEAMLVSFRECIIRFLKCWWLTFFSPRRGCRSSLLSKMSGKGHEKDPSQLVLDFSTSPAVSGVNGCNNSTSKSTLIRVVSAIK